jgi:hypothetical protein
MQITKRQVNKIFCHKLEEHMRIETSQWTVAETKLSRYIPRWVKGVNLAPRGEICPLGGMFTPSFTPRGEHSV